MSAYDYEYDFPVTLPAARDEVFRALTDPAALERWFAEHVRIDLRDGGEFRFWGRHTLGTTDESSATQRITDLVAGRSIAFSWRFLERDSEVRWSVEDEVKESGSRISICHSFAALPDLERAEHLVDDHWRICTGNLCFYLHGRDIYRPDYDDPSPEVRSELLIDAPRETVFAVLVTPEYISQWFPAPNPVVEPRVGGKYGFGFSYEVDGQTVEPPPMEILEYVENEKLTITWPDWRGDASVPDQQVSFLLADEGGKTRLTLRHTGFIRQADVSDYPFGWGEFLDKIAAVASEVR